MSRQTRSIRIRRGRAIAGAGALAASLAFAAAVAAEPVTGGETTLRPDKDTFEALSDLEIEVVPTNGADFGPKGIVFPITGGEFNPNGKIKFKHSGGVKLQRDDAKVKFKNLVARGRNDESILKAQVGDDKLVLADLDVSDLKGNQTTFRNIHATLAAEAADVLTAAFDMEFPEGQPVGKLRIEAELEG